MSTTWRLTATKEVSKARKAGPAPVGSAGSDVVEMCAENCTKDAMKDAKNKHTSPAIYIG